MILINKAICLRRQQMNLKFSPNSLNYINSKIEYGTPCNACHSKTDRTPIQAPSAELALPEGSESLLCHLFGDSFLKINQVKCLNK